MDFTAYIENLKKEQRKKNIKELRDNINRAWVNEKIESHNQRFGSMFSTTIIKNEIMTNDLVASFFCKDPSKQNISEKVCESLLNTKSLPQTGKNCIRFNNDGAIVSTALGNTKSADFYYKGHYMTQKYTTDEGGAQDNQKNDVIDFLKRGSISNKVGAILDGPYWDKNRSLVASLFTNNANVWITSMSELMED